MFEMIKFDMFVEFMKMDRKHLHRSYDWTQEFARPVPVKISLMDRVLPAIGETLISIGMKLKQHSRARLNAEQAQTPTFMIML